MAGSYTLYGRRKGRPLRAVKAALMQTLLPRLAVAAGDAPLDLGALFPGKKQVWLEVGFGGGEHLAFQAALHPDTGFIGCEPFANGVASLAEHIHRQSLGNIRIYQGDARHMLDRLPDHCISTCFVLFADPWPKKRHAERRFIAAENLTKLARILVPGGELRLASDHPVLQAWLEEQMQGCPYFIPAPDTVQGRLPEKPDAWPTTRYEQKGVKEGRLARYYRFLRG